MKALLILVISGAVLAQTPAPAKKAPAPATPAPAAKTAAAPPKAAPIPAALLNPASLKAKAPDLFRVKFVTTHGDFVVEVHRDWAPLGADRLYNLVKARFFTDNAFYRYSPGFIVQFGVSANPAVTDAWAKAPIKDDPVKESNKKGTLTFATSGPNSRTTDFFINLKDNGTSLDSLGFSALGNVTEGMDIVEGLYSGYGEMKEMGGRGPSQPLVMTQGKPYLDKNFPKLDSIKSATVIFPEPAAPAAPAVKKAAPGATAAPATAPKSAPPPAPAKKQ
jgi:peptidyl-prolyl cis-trans isomerase A (cyclophilin A)